MMLVGAYSVVLRHQSFKKPPTSAAFSTQILPYISGVFSFAVRATPKSVEYALHPGLVCSQDSKDRPGHKKTPREFVLQYKLEPWQWYTVPLPLYMLKVFHVLAKSRLYFDINMLHIYRVGFVQ